jgi:hypothetical protein
MYTILGILGGLLALISNIPYIRDILKKTTKPHRVTWGIFFLLNIIFLGNQLAAGATSSIWLVIAFTLSTLIIFSLSLKYGVGGTTKLDVMILIGSLVGVGLWQILQAPIASVLANLVVATIAAIPTYRKAWLQPQTETKLSFLLGTIAAAFTVVSVGGMSLVLLLLPIYSVVYNGSIYLILTKRIRPASH